MHLSLKKLALQFVAVTSFTFVFTSCNSSLKEEKIPDVQSFIDVSSSTDGFFYVGWDECPWCSVYKPEFYDILGNFDVETVYSFSPYSIKGLNDEGNDYKSNDYRRFVEYIDSSSDYKAIELGYLKKYSDEIDLNWFYAPKLYKYEDGKLVGAVGVLDGHVKIDGVVMGLSEVQKAMLEEQIKKIL